MPGQQAQIAARERSVRGAGRGVELRRGLGPEQHPHAGTGASELRSRPVRLQAARLARDPARVGDPRRPRGRPARRRQRAFVELDHPSQEQRQRFLEVVARERDLDLVEHAGRPCGPAPRRRTAARRAAPARHAARSRAPAACRSRRRSARRRAAARRAPRPRPGCPRPRGRCRMRPPPPCSARGRGGPWPARGSARPAARADATSARRSLTEPWTSSSAGPSPATSQPISVPSAERTSSIARS